ncbi:hemerythrin domain-containing protein [Ponticoccus sp. SC2-23]|uniref:hemerythrin domain-containing protein n=1 Tax=Alexandriicola marinus TaxID=2081710 RepID=UPI000FDC0838|nr:hemerythrin domain-containing protein [Alexandriicola marinus]MBM1221499.1 hemerythrin domain-containing protein [Ponticoccus sp. SC6-9]MBM1226540.1 hemerythrin domain-containing protein [Ponticoccus sp. SC6-15]MBM1230491.1 hemerythrin domain-containing protein [Ponticoccus sp. SC6-38]MBM1235014.1 hemerythrin domain-containing protein [Ponticoccus sp. SC6-45]MBM1239512.1 hemerythrin domain-containing protein [Ponticoccus sp. SC6-49]MBM1243294.1 hemerythrin domain-containing protein [Pontic
MTDETLALDTRDRLPDALRALVEQIPRDSWQTHPNFDQLVSFWLERHMMFRKLMDMLQGDAQALIDARMDQRDYANRLGRFGGMFVNELHGHHQIEDHHYFPVLARAEPDFARGFEILDTDHHAIDATLNRFVERANAVLQNSGDPIVFRDTTGRLSEEMTSMARLLDRHLEDEEELVAPVLLRHGPALFS